MFSIGRLIRFTPAAIMVLGPAGCADFAPDDYGDGLYTYNRIYAPDDAYSDAWYDPYGGSGFYRGDYGDHSLHDCRHPGGFDRFAHHGFLGGHGGMHLAAGGRFGGLGGHGGSGRG